MKLFSPKKVSKKILTFFIFISFSISNQLGATCLKTIPLTIHKHIFRVELADTPETQAKGLMYRKHLDIDKGMLFVFPKEKISIFWMKNTLIPLDMIWISENKKVVFIQENTPPLDETPIVPSANARYVLELNAGSCQKLNIKLGAIVSF